jgi:hypothetical protein
MVKTVSSRFFVAGRRWKVRSARGPIISEKGDRCAVRIDWDRCRLVYDQILTAELLARLLPIAVGRVWEGSIEAMSGGVPVERCCELALLSN